MKTVSIFRTNRGFSGITPQVTLLIHIASNFSTTNFFQVLHTDEAQTVRTMDPHSRHSQFNQRSPKSGPFSPTVRFEQPQKITLDKYTKASSDSVLFTSRPIATNSRVKQDEQFKKDMFLAFVNNALLEKLNVSILSDQSILY